jgi:hypothetical protein
VRQTPSSLTVRSRWRGQPTHDALDGAFPVGSRRGQSRDRAVSGASRSPNRLSAGSQVRNEVR